MNIMRQLFATAFLAGVLVTTPALAQDDQWEFDDPLAFGLLMDLDLQFEDLDLQLEDLDETLGLELTSHLPWGENYCEGKEACEVRIVVDKGKRIVIVNGDTVDAGDDSFPHNKGFSYKFGPGMHFRGYGPSGDFHRRLGKHFGFNSDPELRQLERDARTIARKARDASDDERAALEAELDQKLTEIFDHKLRRQEEAIRKAEERLSKLRERQSKRESARDEIIESRKDELLGRDRYLEW